MNFETGRRAPGIRPRGSGLGKVIGLRHEAPGSAFDTLERTHETIDHAADLLALANEYIGLPRCEELEPLSDCREDANEKDAASLQYAISAIRDRLKRAVTANRPA